MIVQHRRNPRRGSALFAGLVLALGLTTLTRAEAPPATGPTATDAAELALEPWRAALDAQDYAKTWEEASPVFRQAITADEWAKTAAAAYDQLGAVRSREPLTQTVSDSLPGAPDGRYAVLQYRTAFEKVPSAVETFTLRLDPASGAWRVVGRNVRPGVQDPVVQRSLDQWLALVDAKDYARSWDEAAPDFRAQIARGDWSQSVRTARGAYGELRTRQVLALVEQGALAGARPGRYVIAQTNASFEKKASAVETVTLQLAPDGRWRVVGYFIQ